MATTSPDNIRTPNPTDNFNLVADLATTASDVQDALTRRANTYKGTASQRGSLTSTAANGTLWQDTDGIKMLWRKDGAVWVPADMRWSGTTAQMDALTSAPEGFKWFNTTDNSEYIRLGGSWVSLSGFHNYPSTSGGSSSGWSWSTPQTVTFPTAFPTTPKLVVQTQAPGDFLIFASITAISTTGFTYRVVRIGANVGAGRIAWVASL